MNKGGVSSKFSGVLGLLVRSMKVIANKLALHPKTDVISNDIRMSIDEVLGCLVRYSAAISGTSLNSDQAIQLQCMNVKLDTVGSFELFRTAFIADLGTVRELGDALANSILQYYFPTVHGNMDISAIMGSAPSGLNWDKIFNAIRALGGCTITFDPVRDFKAAFKNLFRILDPTRFPVPPGLSMQNTWGITTAETYNSPYISFPGETVNSDPTTQPTEISLEKVKFGTGALADVNFVRSSGHGLSHEASLSTTNGSRTFTLRLHSGTTLTSENNSWIAVVHLLVAETNAFASVQIPTGTISLDGEALDIVSVNPATCVTYNVAGPPISPALVALTATPGASHKLGLLTFEVPINSGSSNGYVDLEFALNYSGGTSYFVGFNVDFSLNHSVKMTEPARYYPVHGRKGVDAYAITNWVDFGGILRQGRLPLQSAIAPFFTLLGQEHVALIGQFLNYMFNRAGPAAVNKYSAYGFGALGSSTSPDQLLVWPIVITDLATWQRFLQEIRNDVMATFAIIEMSAATRLDWLSTQRILSQRDFDGSYLEA